MPRRFAIPAIPKGEEARYAANPFESSINYGYIGQTVNTDLIVRPNDELLIQKGGAEAFNVYTRLIFDETVQSALVKMSQEITSREWKLEPATEKAGDVAVRDYVEEQLSRLQVDEIYRGMLESYVVGFTVPL